MYYLSIDTETGGPSPDVSLLTAAFVLYDENLEEINYLDLALIPDDGRYVVEPRALDINKINLSELAKIATRTKKLGHNYICG